MTRLRNIVQILVLIYSFSNYSVHSFQSHQAERSLKSCCTKLKRISPSQPIHGLYNSKNTCHMSNLNDDAMDSNAYRIESLKGAFISTIGGSIGSLPVAILIGYFNNFNAQWEFSHDALAVSLFLFGVVYRYVVRKNTNPQLQLGAIGAFAIVCALNTVIVPSTCTSMPLNCGYPFILFDWSMLLSGSVTLVESMIAFGTAALAIEFCFDKKVLSKCE